MSSRRGFLFPRGSVRTSQYGLVVRRHAPLLRSVCVCVCVWRGGFHTMWWGPPPPEWVLFPGALFCSWSARASQYGLQYGVVPRDGIAICVCHPPLGREGVSTHHAAVPPSPPYVYGVTHPLAGPASYLPISPHISPYLPAGLASPAASPAFRLQSWRAAAQPRGSSA